jgi:hypothetical protein
VAGKILTHRITQNAGAFAVNYRDRVITGPKGIMQITVKLHYRFIDS